MTTRPPATFGRRGRSHAPVRATVPVRNTEAPPLSEDLVASIIRPNTAAPSRPEEIRRIRVARSLRAAILAGLCVGFLDAALHATDLSAYGKTLASLLGISAVSAPAIALLIALWSGARATAFSLLLTHRALDHFGWTQLPAYALAGGCVALVYAAAINLSGLSPVPHALGLDFLSGLGAGFFYRLFAGTSRGT